MDKAILVGADLLKDGMMGYYMEELEQLAKASNVEVQYSITQQIHQVNPPFYIGKGKVDEIKSYVDNLDVNMVIFNNELSGSQIRNLEEIFDVRVIDRTMLILDIFAKRAKTREAMLQVEIAQLNYLRPRLVGLVSSLNRQQGGIGSRGPGEKKLELDRRRIDHEKVKLEKELIEVVKARKVQRKNRNKTNIKKIAIVGYTNAGKSTLMNTLIDYTQKDLDKRVFEKDMLFATLETSTRKITLSNNNEFLITDTVGFVSNLPHLLVESFKSTLEEITEADLLVHVVDSSHDEHEEQVEITNNTLQDIGVHDIPMVYIYNKLDLLTKPLTSVHYPNVQVSLKMDKDLSNVITLITNELYKDFEVVTLLIPFTKGDLLSYFENETNILERAFTHEGTVLKVELSEIQMNKYYQYIQKED